MVFAAFLMVEKFGYSAAQVSLLFLVNYAFTALWVVEAVWWHANPTAYRERPRAVAIAVHTPRFPYEEHLAEVRSAVAQHQITVPVLHDPEYLTWNRDWCDPNNDGPPTDGNAAARHYRCCR